MPLPLLSAAKNGLVTTRSRSFRTNTDSRWLRYEGVGSDDAVGEDDAANFSDKLAT